MMNRWIPLILLCGIWLPAIAQSKQVEGVTVDLRDSRKSVFHAQLNIPVHPGPITLVYPKWIPGDHAPSGPIGNLAGLTMTANGQSLEWFRDKVDLYAFHVEVPQGVSVLSVKLDFLAIASNAGATANASIATTDKLADLRWHLVMLYPQDAKLSELVCKPSILLPEGWHYATALKTSAENGSDIQFTPVTLERLIDSPVIAGEYFRRFAIAPEVTPHHFINIVADAPEDLKTSAKQEQAWSNLVYQANALFGSHHFESYDFLVTLSGKMMSRGTGIGGQEHHESSDNIGSENIFRDPAGVQTVGSTLSHEYAHSWNGKYRRPVGEVHDNYQVPIENDLLWVYEGLTDYLGEVLAVRSGAWTPEQFRDAWANDAADMEYRPGRQWKDLLDTAVGLPTLMNARPGWGSWRRGADYYPEGGLLWLDVDVTIRNLTQGKKSLDDFCRIFFGPAGNHEPEVVAYDFKEVVRDLDSVAPNNWASFLNERLRSKSAHAPLGGITNSGWTVAYEDVPNEFLKLSEQDRGTLDAMYSVGLSVLQDGTLLDVRWGSPAYAAGLGPEMKIVAVQGRQFSLARLKASIQEAKTTSKPIVLTISNTGYEHRIEIAWDGGERYPRLERKAGTTDVLGEIARPLPVSKR